MNFNRTNIQTIVVKELKQYFTNPTAYVVMVVFLLLWQFLFFRNAFIVGEATLRGLFDYLPWLFLLLIPAITMGTISEEKNNGTLEFLLTHPISSLEVLIGKFIAALTFTATTLLFIFPIAFAFDQFGTMDWGVVFGQYLGSVLMAAVFIALGLFISSLFETQIASLLVTASIGFLLIISGSEFLTASVPFTVASILEQLSVITHFSSIARGVIDLRDLWYFLSVTTAFLALAYLQLLKITYGNRRSEFRTYQNGTLLFIGIVILTNVIGSRIPGRIDLTQGKLYTLSDATTNILQELDDVVNITVYTSDQLPAQIQPVIRDTKDILRDYRTTSSGNVIVNYKNPSQDPQIAQEATALGITQIDFNVIGQEELQLKRGFFGLAVSYGDEHEVIPVIQDTSDLEYQLTSFINQLTADEKKTIGFLSGHGEKSITMEYGLFTSELEKQFTVEEITIDDENPTIPDEVSTLVIASPTQEINQATTDAIKQFISDGKSLLFMTETVSIDPQTLAATNNENSFASFMANYGVTIEQNLVYDLRSNETVNFGDGSQGLSYLVPYPLWLRGLANDSSNQITTRIENITLPWASSITLDDSKIQGQGFQSNVLFTTSEFAGVQTENYVINPDQQFAETDLSERILAVSLAGGEKENSAQRARIIVVSDSQFLTDQFISNSPQNFGFGMEALSWLSQEESLAEIQLKQRAESKLLFENSTQPTIVKYGNMALVILLPAATAFYILNQRKQRKQQHYISQS